MFSYRIGSLRRLPNKLSNQQKFCNTTEMLQYYGILHLPYAIIKIQPNWKLPLIATNRGVKAVMLETLSLFLGIWLLFLLLAIYYLSQSPSGGISRHFRDSVSEHLSAESR